MKFDLLITIGFKTSTLLEEIDNIMKESRRQFYLFLIAKKHKLNSHFESKELIDSLVRNCRELNTWIKGYNRNIRQVNIELRLEKINLSRFKQEVHKFFEIKKGYNEETYKEVIPHLVNNFDLYLQSIFGDVTKVLYDTDNYIDQKINSFGVNNINKKYRKDVLEVIDLFFIGYKNTSLLVLGKVFEEIITRYMIELHKNNKIKKNLTEIMRMRFTDKLGLLKSLNYIGEKDWLIISKLRFDRDIGGHFLTMPSIRKSMQAKKESALESEETIKLALRLISKFDKKT